MIEEIGLRHEEENEQKFRELKQFGYQPEWTFKGTIKDEHISLPDPIQHRPRLGARILVRSYVRRYLKALYGEIGSWIEEHQLRAANLLVYSVSYVEEYMTQYMDHLLVAMYKAILRKDSQKIVDRVSETFRLLGRYVQPTAYMVFVVKAMSNQLASFYAYTAPGSLRAVGYLLAGSIELLQPGQDLAHMVESMEQLVDTIKVCVIDSLDIETADHLIETLHIFV